MWNQDGAGSNLGMFFFFFFLFFSYLFFWSVYVCKCDKGFVHFLHIVANSPAFQNKWTNIRRCEQKILNKYNKSG